MDQFNFSMQSRQGGFSLIVSLMMLIVIIILGISASQMAVNEERGARNDRDRQIAFQAAEAALIDGETEILVSSGCKSHTNQAPVGGRIGASVCFDEQAGTGGFAPPGSVPACSSGPAVGLCDSVAPSVPSKATSVDFYGDASGSNALPTSVQYGQFTHNNFPSQLSPGLAGQPISKYPPRYIIERVNKNVVLGSAPGKYMFRVTAMGFGANPNAQVVLQSVVNTF